VPTVLSSIESFLVAAWHGITGWHAPEVRPTIVAFLADEQDRKMLTGICRRQQWDVHFSDVCQDGAVPIILCDRDLGEWRDLVRALAASRPNACVILISRVVDTYLWNEVAHAGGYDVLSKPLREADVVRVVKLAWSYWNSITK
jgi:hypothetical protein